MQGLEDQQFFTPGEPQPPHGGGGHSRRALVIAVVAVAALAVAVLLGLYIKNRFTGPFSDGYGDGTDIEADIASEVSRECADADDVAACEDRVRSEMAQDAAMPEACEGLEEPAFTNCVMLIAQDEMDAAVCSALDAEAKTSCQDDVAFRLAVANEDYAACADLTDETLRANCEARLLSVVIASGDCAAYGVDASVCNGQAQLDAVIAAGDPEGCNTLPDELEGDCRDAFASLDADHDGLSLGEEYGYGTDPKNADTDGDGYNDGREVQNGYDPTK
ncbi:hypothetical protein HYS28_02910 [Candidatus Uhrbacteria bacterium]|nr:hypothetical protein [Candidatus Uhrbacteria bacterium]